MGKGNYKTIDIKEFREKGYLQEVNRRFFHRLGMALVVYVRNDNGEEGLSCIRDHQEEGIEYGFKTMKPKELVKYQERANFVDNCMSDHSEIRGYWGKEEIPEWNELERGTHLIPIDDFIKMVEGDGVFMSSDGMGFYATDKYEDLNAMVDFHHIEKKAPYTHIAWYNN
jgi:phosphoenolpyruvate synthase/pyruvate phosphate dikinase